jgi:hypothetical protein
MEEPQPKHRKHRAPSKVQASGYCSAHRKYAFSENDAQELLQQVKGHHGKGGKVESRSYKCPWGDHWHLTSRDA